MAEGEKPTQSSKPVSTVLWKRASNPRKLEMSICRAPAVSHLTFQTTFQDEEQEQRNNLCLLEKQLTILLMG